MSPRLHNLLMTSTALLALGSVYAGAQPTGPNVVGGSATVSGAGTNSVIVNQTTDRAIINWNTFNVSTGGSATFNQPGSSSITLNRVTGGLGPSVIDGTISANGRVFIINRDGMLFGRNAVINTAGFLATTNDIRNADFMAGRMNFNIPGRGDASIVNLGNITASSHGFAALVAPGVRNSGTISANLGTVALASGNSFTLDMYGDRLIQVAVGDEIAGKVIDVATGKPLSSLVTNEGTLRANGGRVEITAAAARHIVDSVINTKGVIEANSVGTRNGRIVLGGAPKTAGLPKQTIKVSGKISATGKNKGSKGGTIQITGEDIQFAAAMLDVSGHAGGGKILVGGDYAGGKPIPDFVKNQSAVLENEAIATATTVTVDAATTFNASATANGHGGKVILWSDVLTTFAGTIFARGGEQGGNGGFVEVSGKQQLAFTGSVNTMAPHGAAGTLLLDPADYYIDIDGGPTRPTGASVITKSSLEAQLEQGNVIITTNNDADPIGQFGDISVNANITWSSINSLTLSANRNVVVNANITNNGGYANVVLRADNTGTGVGTVSFGSGTISTAGNVSIFYNPSVNPVDSLVNGTSYLSPVESFTASVTGGAQLNAYMLVNTVNDLQNVRNNLSGDYALGRDIDASGTANWNDGRGFVPIGTDKDRFGGSLNGQNFTISGLTINPGASANPNTLIVHLGLFGVTDDAPISNLKLENVIVTGSADGQVIGGLVGHNYNGHIENVSIVGVSAINAASSNSITAGGLVGVNEGTITNAHAAINVFIGNGSSHEARDAHAGGLVGLNYGSVAGSSASGNVLGGGNTLLGGLVGSNGDHENGYFDYGSESWGPTISGSFATGTVRAESEVTQHQMATAGGLVGDNWGRITDSYASGNVTIKGHIRAMAAGGLVGQLLNAYGDGTSSIATSYASGNVTAISTYHDNSRSYGGGLVGETQWGTTIKNVYALGSVTVAGADSNYEIKAGGLLGNLAGFVSRAYSTGAVTAADGNAATLYLGGFAGVRYWGSYVTAGYWDKTSSGLTNAVGAGSHYGIKGLADGGAFTQLKYAGLDFGVEGHWYMIDGQTRPFLRMEHSTTIRNTHQLQLIAMNLDADYLLANDLDFAGAFNASGMWGTSGFAPIGSAGSPFTGSLNGDNLNGGRFTIKELTIAPNNATLQSVGMFSVIGAGGSVSYLNLTNANVSANPGFQQPIQGPPVSQWVGILAGQSGGVIHHVTATGTVNGGSVVGVIAGGLVGQHGILGPGGPSTHMAGTITDSWANVTVTVGDGDVCPGSCMFNAAGGLVGVNVAGSSIADSFAEGTITGGARTWAGGLVGQNGFFNPAGAFGTITNSYATGNVTVTGDQSAAGGLVGSNTPGSTITNSQAFGNVASTFAGPGEAKAGGLVGENAGAITSTPTPNVLASNCTIGASFSCATGNVSVGMMGSGGGLVGSNNGTIEKSFATGNVTGTSGLGDTEAATRLGGLAGSNRGEISDSFARGTVGSITSNFIVAGGLVGDNSGTILNSTASGNVLAGTFSLAGGLVGAHFSEMRSAALGDSFAVSYESNSALIRNSSASGNVSVGNAGYGGGLVGATNGTIGNSFASGAVIGHGTALLGGLAGANAGDITGSYATGNVTAEQGNAGGFVGLNLGWIELSYAKGNVSSSGFAMLGGFVGLNAGEINQAYAIGAVSGAPGGYLGGFVGLNVNAEITFGDAGFGSDALNGKISQSYALNPVTGSNAVVAGGFAALNFGSLDQVYGVGHVQGATTLGGLVGANNGTATVPDWGSPHTINGPAGTATNSYWDMQTTAMLTSAGGTGMNTAALAGGLPAGFESGIWGSHSYPYLLAMENPPLGPQDTNPLPPVIPPVGVVNNDLFLPPPDQQINPSAIGSGPQSDPVPNVTQFVQQQQQKQQQRGQQGETTGSIGQDPIRLDVGENRFFYLPPLNETRLISDEVVLQMPCNVPKAVLDEIIKLHNLTTVASQCLQEGGNAAFRMRHASSETVGAVIRALAAHQVIAAAQANYVYTTQETSVQSATSQQGDPGQYVPEKLRLLAAHRVVTGNGIPIAVIDSEIDASHPDLSGTIANRYDATGVEDTPHPHGTGMAGAIVSHQKLLGIAPGARIIAIRAFSPRASNTESTTYHILRGLDHAVANNVRIINMSFAGPRDPSIERALKAAYDKGVVLIAAAGNAGPRAPALYPAADPNVIAVTATDIDDRLFTGANRGNHVAIAAPGVDILVPAPAGEYQVTTGTSVATAHISGVVALMLERNAKLTPAEVRKILAASAKRLGPANQFGAGLVDPVRAIEMSTPRSAAAPATPRPAAAAAAPRATATAAARP